MTSHEIELAKLPRLLSDLARDAFGEGLGAVVVHGSGHRGKDFIPHWSDFDCHLYVNASVLSMSQAERIDRALRFRRGFARLDPREFAVYYIQVFFLLFDVYPPEWPVPVEGTFEIAYGLRPVGWDAPSHPDALSAASSTLTAVSGTLDGIATEVPDLRGENFARWVRRLGTYVKPALYAAATIVTSDPDTTWSSDLESVLSVMSDHVELPSARKFYDRAYRWLDVRSDEAELEAMTRDGIEVLQTLSLWHGSRSVQ